MHQTRRCVGPIGADTNDRATGSIDAGPRDQSDVIRATALQACKISMMQRSRLDVELDSHEQSDADDRREDQGARRDLLDKADLAHGASAVWFWGVSADAARKSLAVTAPSVSA